GADDTAYTGVETTLDGSGSYDDDGDELEYRWRFESVPSGSTLASTDITDRASENPSFTPDADGEYVLLLQVDDGTDTDEDSVTITSEEYTGTAPVADAGADEDGQVDVRTILDGSDSYDDDGDDLTYAWVFVSKPVTSSLDDSDIRRSDEEKPRFTPDVPGNFRLELTVSDGVDSDTDQVTVSVYVNRAPEADAGEDQDAVVDDTVTLDGSGSSDPDGDDIAYEWTLIAPEGSTASLDDDSSETPSFDADVPGVFFVILNVYDGEITGTDNVLVRVALDDSDNEPPWANAGYNLSAEVGSDAVVDGSGSIDPDGDALTYSWTFAITPPISSLADGDIEDADTDLAYFVPDVAGAFRLGLEVSDGEEADTDAVRVWSYDVGDNAPPVSNPGIIYEAYIGSDMTLDGSESYDDDGDEFTYEWTFSNVPATSFLADEDIEDADTATPTFTPDVAGTYRLVLLVDDGTDSTFDDVPVIIMSDNESPSADAGGNQEVEIGETAVVDGSGSSDPDGDPLEYSWLLIPPVGSSATLDDDTAVSPTFEPDELGDYTLILTVSDGDDSDHTHTGSSHTATDYAVWTARVSNSAPVAYAGEDDTVGVGERAILDGSESSDVDGDTLFFSWSFDSQPSGSSLDDGDIIGGGFATPSFFPDVAGEFVLRLEVTDGFDTDEDTVTITAE
ncbi:MAG: PKD domain-containing protein, partial [Myxococcota bacterium]|nr:PKD domain-containing protein [Myxococcota bacterium]